MLTAMPRTSRLQRELRQRKPFSSPEQEAGLALLRTADLVRRRVARVVEPHGITVQQYNVLRILRGAGEAGIATLEIARRMIEQTPGITRLLDRLEAKHLVRRERCPKDRRRMLCWISPAGLKLLAQMDAPVARADGQTLHGLGKSKLGQLIALLDAVRGEVE